MAAPVADTAAAAAAAAATPPDQVARALSATLSNLASERQAAETLLTHLAHTDDHAAHLLRLAAGPDSVVAPAAALRLKNLMRSCRSSTPTLSETARFLVRDNILPALSVARASAVESVLAETTRWLVLLDFPARWPALLPTISEFLSSGDSARVHAALVALRQLVKCYEFKSRDPERLMQSDPNEAGLAHPRQPLDSIAAACFPTLLALYTHLDAMLQAADAQHTQRHDSASASAGNANVSSGTDVTPSDQHSQLQQNPPDQQLTHAMLAQRLIVKIFWSCTQFILPPCLADDGALDQWMRTLFETLRRPSRHPFVEDPDDLALLPEWKTKKWISQVVTRFLKRYGSPKKVPLDEPGARVVAEVFKDRHAEAATKVMLEVLSAETKGHQLSRRVAHLALDFMEEAIETAQLWAIIRPHVDTLLAQVVFRYLYFSDDDEDLWLNDPAEYVRKQYDFTEDFTSPRMAASNLLSKMADLRSKSTILPFLQYLLQTVLDPYQNAPVGSQARAALARQKVGAFASLAAVKAKLISKRELSTSFMRVLKAHVEPDMRSEFGFLRSEAAWLLGQVASCQWEEFSNELGEVSLRGCVSLLEDANLPVQASAAGALQFLMDAEGPATLIQRVAQHLLERLLILMDRMSDGYYSLLPALDKLVERYPDEIMPLAVPLASRLMAAFQQSSQGILQNGDDEDDDLAFTAAQVLHLISSIISCVGEWSKPSAEDKSRMLTAIEKELEPLLVSMFEESHQVFVEELLDVLGTLVIQTGELNGRVSPFLLSLIPKMVVGFEIWAADYVGQMMDAIEGYLTYGMRDILATDGGIAAFVAIVERLWSDKFDGSDAVYGARIAEVMILNLGKTETPNQALKEEVVVKIARGAAERCVKSDEAETVLRQGLFSVVMVCCYVDAERVLRGLGAESVMQLVASQTANLVAFERISTKKCAILGMGAVLRTRGVVREESKPHVLRLVVRLQEMIDEQRSNGGEVSDFSLKTRPNGLGGSLADAAASALGRDEGGGSDLEDDQDAVNFMDELNERGGMTELERLALGTGFPVKELEQMDNNTRLYLEAGMFEIDDVEEEDEGGFRGKALDEINETVFLVSCVKEAAGTAGADGWWAKSEERDRQAMEQLAKRVDGRS